jgi:hypothetical protein
MKNNKPDISELHQQFNNVTSETPNLSITRNNKIKFPYEFLVSVDKGWIPCDVLEVDTEKELVKIIFYHPDHAGWIETCQGGVFDDVIPMWRVRLRED